MPGSLDQYLVWGSMGCPSCPRDKQDNLGEHLKAAGMGSGFIGVYWEVDQGVKVNMLGSIASVVGISQDYVRGCYGM